MDKAQQILTEALRFATEYSDDEKYQLWIDEYALLLANNPYCGGAKTLPTIFGMKIERIYDKT